MADMLTTLTERGQVSMPSAIRRQMGLRPGQPLLWKRVSDHEVRVTVPRGAQGKSMRGFIKKLHKKKLLHSILEALTRLQNSMRTG